MFIQVELTGGKVIRLYVEPTDTTDTIKARIENVEGIPSDSYVLMCQGNTLRCGTASQNNIREGSLLEIME